MRRGDARDHGEENEEFDPMRKLENEELNRKSVKDFKNASKNHVVIVLDNVRSLLNVGSAFRTADAFLLEKIYLCGITGIPPHREIQKTALGATETVEWVYEDDAYATTQGLHRSGYTIVAIEQVCSNNGVQPADVVREFLDYYPIGCASRGWKEPVPALLRTLTVQVSKVQSKGKGIERMSSNAMTLEEEIEFQRDTGIRPSSVQADAIRAEWLKKYRAR